MSSATSSLWNSETVNQQAIPLYNALVVGAIAYSINLKGSTLADSAFVETVKAINAGVSLSLFKDCNNVELETLLTQYESVFDSEWKEVFKTSIRDWKRYQEGLRALELLRQSESLCLDQSTVFEIMTNIFENTYMATFGEVIGVKPNRLDSSLDHSAIQDLYSTVGGIDELLKQAHGDLYMSDGLKVHVCSCIGRMSRRLRKAIPQWEMPQYLRIFLTFLECPFFEECLLFADLLEVYQCFILLNSEQRNIFIEWNYRASLADLHSRVGLARLMITMKILEYPDEHNYFQLVKDGSVYIKTGAAYLTILFEANAKRKLRDENDQLTSAFWEKKVILEDLDPSSLQPLHKQHLDITEFYNDAINERLKILDMDFASGYRSNNWVFGLIVNPCVLNAAAKSHLMTLDFHQQQRERNRINFGPYFSIPIPRALLITVHRERLVEDALNWLITAQASSDRRELKYPLRIRFAGEEGLDEGGLTKEFFQLLIYQLFNPDYGMFQLVEDSNNFWFVPDSFAMLIQFELIGIILGLALYNDILLDIHFPKVLYKKLLSGLDGFPAPVKPTPPSVPTNGADDSRNTIQQEILNPIANVTDNENRISPTASQNVPVPGDTGTATRPPGSPSIVNPTAMNAMDALNPANWISRRVAYRFQRNGDNVTVIVCPTANNNNGEDPNARSPETTRRSSNSSNPNQEESHDDSTESASTSSNPMSLHNIIESIFGSAPGSGHSQPTAEPGEFLKANEWDDKTATAEMAHRLPKFHPTIDDLEDLYPHAAKGLRKLLSAPENEVADLNLTFSVTVNLYGEYKDIPLPQVGDEIYDADTAVTAENRETFVQAVLNYYLINSIEKEFRAFYKGFHRCCGGPAILKFSPDELNLVLCGVPGDLDFNQLELGTKYADGYTRESQVVNWFWNVASALTQENKKKLLFFITGCEQTPVGGLKTLRLTIGKAGGEKNRLPTAHTCFNHLLLPEYDAEEDLRRYLIKALDYRHGFGLV